MAQRAIQTITLSDTLSLSECRDGWWLYDETQGMNLAMRANTREEALLDALTFYQQYLALAEKRYKDLENAVHPFVAALAGLDDDPFDLIHPELKD